MSSSRLDKNGASSFDILFEDEDLLILNKPAGILVHPGPKTSLTETCLMHLARRYLGAWVYPVHRLDRATSGILVFAKSSEAARHLAAQFEGRSLQKVYLAVIRGWIHESLTITKALSDLDSEEGEQEAETYIKPLARIALPYPVDRYPEARYSLVQAEPKTGRQHQIRRHLKHINHPIIGDTVYGKGNHNRLFRDELRCPRLLLHHCRLTLEKPSGGPLSLEAPLDKAFGEIMQRFAPFAETASQ